MTQYFADCKTLDELRIAYRKLAAIHHPDVGGDVATMQAINAEHDRVFESLKAAHNASADEYHQTTETPEEFRRVVVELLKLSGLNIEICGSWLWIGGNTREHKEALKALGCKWSKNKMLWSWHHEEAGRKWRRGNYSMGDIRRKYGSYNIQMSETAVAV